MLRLIGHVQAGREPSPELALQQGPIPRFDGFTPTPAPVMPSTLPGPPPGPHPQSIQAQGTGNTPIRIPPLTPEKVAQYSAIFERQPLQGNMLPGDQAKQIFEKSGLSNEVLGRIWMLADTEQRGALVMTEFVIAMHLLTSMKTGALRALPNILPAGLYEAATRRGPAGAALPRSPTGATAPMSAIPRQLSGQAPLAQMRTGSPLGRTPLAPQGTGDWLVTPADKARFDQLYAGLDKNNKGFITGEEAVTFFSQSKLPEDILAQIWDLADFNSEGRLNRDQFAIAMYLIRQQRTKDGHPAPLPATLPPNLIPPSMRGQVRPPPAASSPFDAPAPAAAPPPKQPSALDDLFGLDSPTPSASPAPAQVPVGTGGSPAAGSFGRPTSPPAPSSPIAPTATGTQFKPFMPSSSFGRTLVPQGTGGSAGSAPQAPKAQSQPAAVNDDLLGDNDPEVSNRLNNETTELANMSNQIGSLSKQMQDVQAHRTTTQNELNQASAQKKNFEQRLAQLRSAYEKEAQDVRALETQLTAARNDTKKLQAEAAMLEGTYQDLQGQHARVLAALQADQQENAALKERIRLLNGEIAQLKPQIERLKSEARQQKGLVAINKKQLATNEGEREKLKTEVQDLTKENEELSRQISAGSQQSTQVASPALSATSANNPFFRRTGSTDIASAFASPPPRALNDTSFDDVFGPSPSFPAATVHANTPPPAVAFKPQTTGTSATSVTSGSFATPTSPSPTIGRAATATAEPPAPPESAQISSSHLPFKDVQEESVSSSRQVSPPLSRVSQPETPAAESQAAALETPVEITKTEPSPAPDSGSEPSRNDAASPAGEGMPASNGTTTFFPAVEKISAAPTAGNASDPFGAMDQAKAKDDFESAFASFKKARTQGPEPTSDATKAFASEFPPISELERDDSDSESDRGFDDDFAPASPPSKPTEKKSEGSKPSSPALSKSVPADRAASPSSGSTVAVERPGTRYAPPRLDKYWNVLTDYDSDKPPSPRPAASNVAESHAEDIFGSSAAQQPAEPSHPAPPAASSNAFDDLDDDFEGLEDAKEGSADDDFANISRSGLEDFNPVFDSSPPPSRAAKGDSANNAHFGIESSFDFGSLSTGSTAGSTTAPAASGVTSTAASQPAGAKSGAADAHDWDAIFASLDDGPAAAPAPAPTTASNAPPGSSDGTKKEAERPNPPGRLLTEVGVHDDPILKNLTSMGYSRQDALSALEKYDYNLERVSSQLSIPHCLLSFASEERSRG